MPSYPINVDEPRVYASSFSANSFMYFQISPLAGNPRDLDIVMLPKIGPWLQNEAPEAVNEAMLRFLQQP